MLRKITIYSLLLIFSLIGYQQQGYAQTYSPSVHTVVSKSLGLNGLTADARSYYYDATHFVYRPYQSTAEVLTYLSTTKNRQGNFPIYVNPTGTINSSTGVMTGGSVLEYWFKDGTADANLVQKASGGSSNTFLTPLAVDGSGNVSIQQSSDLQAGYLSAADHAAFNGKQNALTLTTTGSSGAATLTGSTLNIPQYAGQTYTANNGVTLAGSTFSADTGYVRTTANSFSKAEVNTQIANKVSSYVPYSGATTDVDLGTHEYFGGAGEFGGTWPGAGAGGFYNNSATGNAIFIKGGAAGYHNTDFIDYNNNNIGYINGDGTAYFKNGITIANKPASTGTSYAVGDNLEQALANHDNAIATNAGAIAAKQDKIISTYAYGTNTVIANTDDVPGAFGKTQAQLDTKATLSQIDASAISLNEEGTIISDNFDRASLGTNWATTGSGTYSIVSNQLQVNGNTSTYGTSTFITYTPYGNSNLESFTVSEDIYPGTISSTNYGTGIGFESNGTYYKSNLRVMVRFDTGNVGKIEFDNSGNTGTWSNISPNGLSITAGDHLILTIKFIKNKFIASLFDATTNQTNTFDLSISLAANYSFGIPNAYRFTIIGGGNVTNTIDNFQVYSNDLVGVNFLLIGDSITKGIGTSNIFYRWGEQINQVSNTITETNAGNGNTIDDINVSEIVALHPKKIVLLIGVNDFQNGESLATVESKYSNLVSQFNSNGFTAGSNLYLLSLLPGPNYNSTVYNQIPTFNNWVSTTWPTAYLDVNTPLHSTSGVPFNTNYTEDGIHPNDPGHTVIADVLINKLGLQSKPKKQGDYFPIVYNPSGGVTLGDPSLRSTTPKYVLNVLDGTKKSQIHIAGDSTNTGAWVGSTASNSAYISAGWSYNGTNFIARATTATGYSQYNGTHGFYTNTGLTAGSSFSLAQVMFIDANGKVAVGSQSPTAYMDLTGATTSAASLRVRSGVTPTTTNDGDIYNNSTSHHLFSNLNGTWYQLDQQNVNVIATATDANYTVTSSNQLVKLPVITAARTVTLPTPSSYTGMRLTIWNQNNSGNSWSFSGSIVDATGTAITTLSNTAFYYLISDGTNWIKTN